MRFTSGLDDVLASRGHLRILRALDALPEGLAVSVRDLARRAGLAHPRTSEVLAGLTEVGLTTTQRAGRADLYQLNRAHILYPAIHALFADEMRVREDLQRFLRARLRRIKAVREAYLFGSVARNDSKVGSDIDVAVVVPGKQLADTERALEEVSTDARQRFGNELNFHFGSEPLAERLRHRGGQGVWRRVAEEGTLLVSARG